MRILLADDNRLLVEGLTNLLSAHGHQVVATASDGREALARTRTHHPDLVLMDVIMPRCDGLTATRLIKAEMPEMRVVMLTTSAADADLFEAIRSGACGYLLKSVSGDELVASLADVEEGVPPLSRGLAARLLAEFARRSVADRPSDSPDHPDRARTTDVGRTRSRGGTPAVQIGESASPSNGVPIDAMLTKRQAEILRLVAGGLTYKEVASQLGLSERTVRYHMGEIMDRLHLQHRSQVLAYAGQAGLVDHRE